MDNRTLLTCPFCAFGSPDFHELQGHVEFKHPSTTEKTPSTQTLDDFELAQILAFQEAGLPSELALVDCPNISNAARAVERTDDKYPKARPPAEGNDKTWIDCFCGERVLYTELDAHSDMHAQEAVTTDELDQSGEDDGEDILEDENTTPHDIQTAFSTSISKSLRNYDRIEPRTPPSGGRRKSLSLKQLFLGSPTSSRKHPSPAQIKRSTGSVKRLGRSELGPYAHETQMPPWLRRMLEDGAAVTITNKIGPNGTLVRVESIANETPNLVPTFARLSDLDKTVQRAFYCSSRVCHVAKMPREGGFCGYRNIQMLVSYVRDSELTGHEHFRGRLPSILRLQDLIENAWDQGYNSIARIETGGIKMTRKYIGTSEAQAMFSSLKVPCEAMAFFTTAEVEGRDAMLDAVCDYFDDETNTAEKVVVTDKPPIYFQHRGHSMTIVGIERRRLRHAGRDYHSLNLVVFDPMFNPSQAMKTAATAHSFTTPDPARLMKAHRRGETYLSRYRDFELLKLV